MKALKITLEHGRVWIAETSDGKRAQGASLITVLDKLTPVSAFPSTNERVTTVEQTEAGLSLVFDGIRDSGSTGNIARGQASG